MSSNGSDAEDVCDANCGRRGSGMTDGAPRRRDDKDDEDDEDDDVLNVGGKAKLSECVISLLRSCMAGDAIGEL